MAQTRNKICFSYSTRDIRRVQQAKTGLENLGYEVFWGLDISSMSRQDWRKQWCEQCNRADYSVNFLSASYVQSSSCASEWNYAAKHATTVLNITLNGRYGRSAISNLLMNEVADIGGQAIRMWLDSGGQSVGVYPTDDIAMKIHASIARGNNRSNDIQGNTTATSNNRSNGIQGILLSSGTTASGGSHRHVVGGNCLYSNCVRGGSRNGDDELQRAIANGFKTEQPPNHNISMQGNTDSPNVGVHPVNAKNTKWYCGTCDRTFHRMDGFCSKCGRTKNIIRIKNDGTATTQSNTDSPNVRVHPVDAKNTKWHCGTCDRTFHHMNGFCSKCGSKHNVVHFELKEIRPPVWKYSGRDRNGVWVSDYPEETEFLDGLGECTLS